MGATFCTRENSTLWDCGCLSWTERSANDHLPVAFVYMPCQQSECKVEPIVRQEAKDRKLAIAVVPLPMWVYGE